jgi:signal transduction histidine kinase
MQDRILFVDDEEEILGSLKRLLYKEKELYNFANSAKKGLELLEEHQYSVVIADMRMAEMNGVEFLSKVQSLYPDTIRIVLSGYADIDMILGAVNDGKIWQYITKPWRNSDLLILIKNALEIHSYKKIKDELFDKLSKSNLELEIAIHEQDRLKKELELKNSALETIVALRTEELQLANRRLFIMDKTKSDFLKLLSHELRTPLNGLIGLSEIAFGELPKTEDCKNIYALFCQSQKRILNILEDSLMLAQVEFDGDSFIMQKQDLTPILQETLLKSKEYAQLRGITIDFENSGNVQILCEKSLLSKALASIVNTSVNMCTQGKTVSVAYSPIDNGVSLRFISGGLILSENSLNSFFEIFSMKETLTPGGDLGLNPAIAQRIISLFNGTVSVDNLKNSGICITVLFRT